MTKFSQLLAATLLIIAVTPILSAQSISVFGNPNIHYYAGLSTGLTNVSGSGISNVQITKDAGVDTFANSGSKQDVNYGIVGGLNFVRSMAQNWFASYHVGASLWQLAPTNVSGMHTIPINQQQYNYTYKLQLQALSLDVSTDIYTWQKISPFFGAGVDFALANSNNYRETPIGSATPVLLSFASETENLFLYHARLGVRYQLPKQWQLQLAYTYYPNFKVKTGNGDTGLVTTSGFNSSVSLSNLGLQISYQF